MLKNAMIPCAAALITALVTAAPMADAGDTTLNNLSAERVNATISGGGFGDLSIPTYVEKGVFLAILQDSEGINRFSVEAEMSVFIPTGANPPVKIGGIHGILRPLPPPGIHYIVPLRPIGYVEGTWVLQMNNLGSFKLQAYVARSGFDKAPLMGYLSGDFRVMEAGVVHPPLGPPVSAPSLNQQPSRTLEVGDFQQSTGFCGTGCNLPVIDGSSQSVQRHRGAAAIGAQQTLGMADFDDAANLHTGSGYVVTDDSAQVQRRRAAADLDAQTTLGMAGFSDAGSIGTAKDGVSHIDGSSAEVEARRPGQEIGATTNGNVMVIDASNAEFTPRRPARDIGAQRSLQGVLEHVDGTAAEVKPRRPVTDLAAQAALGIGDFNDLPDDEPDLQKGRLRVRYVLFR